MSKFKKVRKLESKYNIFLFILKYDSKSFIIFLSPLYKFNVIYNAVSRSFYTLHKFALKCNHCDPKIYSDCSVRFITL